MLYLISLGLFSVEDMSLRALEVARKCECLFLEQYTTGLEFDIDRLSKLVGRPIKIVSRCDLEEGLQTILELAKNTDVGILVGGDALTATTHITIILEAKKQGIESKVIHGSSIYTAVAETGLQIYKFGRSTTLPKFKAISPYEVIETNRKLGWHTLVLLDIGMTAKEGLELLLELEREQRRNVISDDLEVVVCCRLGSEDAVIKYGKICDLLRLKEIDRYPAVIIVPGELHFVELEALERYRI